MSWSDTAKKKLEAKNKSSTKKSGKGTKKPAKVEDDDEESDEEESDLLRSPNMKRRKQQPRAAKKSSATETRGTTGVLDPADLVSDDNLVSAEEDILLQFDQALKEGPLPEEFQQQYLSELDRSVVTDMASDCIFRPPQRGHAYGQWHIILAGNACNKYLREKGHAILVEKEKLLDDIRCQLLLFGQTLPCQHAYEPSKLSLACWEEKVYREETTKTFKDVCFQYVKISEENLQDSKPHGDATSSKEEPIEEKPHAHLIVRYDNRNGLRSSHLWQQVLRKNGIMCRVQVCDQDEASTKTILAQKRGLEKYLCNVSKPGGIDLTPTRSMNFTLMPETVRTLDANLIRNLRSPCSEPEFYAWILGPNSGFDDGLPHALSQFKALLRRKCDEHNNLPTRLEWMQKYYKYEPFHKRLAYTQSHLRDSKAYNSLKDDVAIIQAQKFRSYLYRDFLWRALDMPCVCKTKLKKVSSAANIPNKKSASNVIAESFGEQSDGEDEEDQHLNCLEPENDSDHTLPTQEIKDMVLKSNRFQNFKRMLKYKSYHEYNLRLAPNMGECTLRVIEDQHRLSPRDLNVHFHGKKGNSGKTELANTIIDVVAQSTSYEDFFILRIANSTFGTSSMRDTQVYKILSFNDISNKTLSGSLTKSLLEWDFSPVEVKFGQVWVLFCLMSFEKVYFVYPHGIVCEHKCAFALHSFSNKIRIPTHSYAKAFVSPRIRILLNSYPDALVYTPIFQKFSPDTTPEALHTFQCVNQQRLHEVFRESQVQLVHR